MTTSPRDKDNASSYMCDNQFGAAETHDSDFVPRTFVLIKQLIY